MHTLTQIRGSDKMLEKFIKYFKPATYFVLLPLAVILLIAWFAVDSATGNKVDSLNAQAGVLNSKSLNITPSSLKLDATGSQSSKTVADMKDLKDLFTKMTTWTDGKSYTENRQLVQKSVSGTDFYNKVYVADTDATGQSMVDALNTKSKTQQIYIYQKGANKYRVIVSAYGYHKIADLQHATNLDVSSTSLEVEGSKGHWNVTSFDANFGEDEE